MSNKILLAADYVDNFHCKCGECRNCCCLGWPVTISFNEYNRLLGLNCKKSLKERLDCSFYILKDCSSERYAEIDRDYNGECKLRDKDGLCSLQRHLGEWALTEVCKAYPRNYKNGGLAEGACANSCEKVIEMLIENTNKVTFKKEVLSVDSEKYNDFPDNFSDIQKNMTEILENRDFNMAIRLINLRKYLSNKMNNKNFSELYNENIKLEEYKMSVEVFSKVLSLGKYLNNYSESVCKYGSDAMKSICGDLKNDEKILSNFKRLKKDLYVKFPDFDIYMEKILVNHIFFERFPYSFTNESYLDEYTAILGVYVMTTIACVGFMADKTKTSDFVDCISGVYRYFEHADFSSLAKKAFNSLEITSKEKQAELASI